jgi:hypothetical protein
MISNSQRQGMLNHAGAGDRILTNFVSSRISNQKKLSDRLLCLRSGIQKTQGFSESDRRGINATFIIIFTTGH